MGAGAARAAADRPLYYDRPLTGADLDGRTLRELAIMRNTIFARAGQPFRKKWLHDYFSAQAWYKPKAIVDPQTLPKVDQENAAKLSHYEIELPRADLDARLQAILLRHRFARRDGTAAAFSPDGKQVYLASGSVVEVDGLDPKRVIADDLASTEVLGFAAVPGKIVARGGDQISTLEVRPPKLKVLSEITVDGVGFRPIVSLSADGQRLLAGPSYMISDDDPDSRPQLDEKTVVVFDLSSGKKLLTRAATDEKPCLALSPDGHGALVSDAGGVALFDADTGKALWRHDRGAATADAARCTAVAISPDGRVAVKAARAGSLLIDMASGKVLRTLRLPFGDHLAFSADGARLLVAGDTTGARDQSLEIWDVARGQRLVSLARGGSNPGLAWSPDGKRVLTDGDRGPVLWDAATGQALPAFDGYETWWNRDEQIEAVLLSRALGRPLEQFAELDFDRTPFDDPALLDELMPVDKLKEMSGRDLRLLRNMVYARRGRRFKSPILREYFEKLAWYKVDPAYSDARLTAVDHRNIKLIQSAENELGGPLTDRQHREANENDVPEA
jgi:DNA-binding beta-propeller fold protein YncE